MISALRWAGVAVTAALTGNFGWAQTTERASLGSAGAESNSGWISDRIGSATAHTYVWRHVA